MKLIVATHNPHKLREIREIFPMPRSDLVPPADGIGSDNLDLIGLEAYPGIPPLIENEQTLEGNAVKKAVTIAIATGEWTMADDSGLEVRALGGAPGVCSARYAGEPVDYAANNAKLLHEMDGVEDRTAWFRCVIALSRPAGIAQTVTGACKGRIALELKGSAGFGYDPLFVPAGYERTFSELGPGIKNSISHRARALALAWQEWAHVLARA